MAMNEPHPNPPVAAVRPHPVTATHGVRTDPYYWLRDDDRANPEVLAYLEAENAYRERCTAAYKPFENALYEEIVSRLKQDDAGVPYRKHGYWYNSRFEPGKEHPIFTRRRDARDAPEEVILDANALAAGHDYYQVGALEVSPDNAWLAFCEDTVGRRQYNLRFKNLLTGEILQTTIPDVESDLAWANDNRTLLYVEKDPETLLGLYVKKHVLGTDPRHDALAFEQKDRSFYTGVSKSKSDRFIFIHMESTVSSEWRYAHADDPALEFKTFLPHERDHEYQVEHLGGAFIIRTNWQARNFRLMQVPIGRESSRAEWQDVVAHRDDHLHRRFRRVQRLSCPVGPQRRACQDQHRSVDPGSAPRSFSSPVTRPPTRHRCRPIRNSTPIGPLRVFLAHHADDGVRLQCAHRRKDPAEARSGRRQLRSRELSNRTAVRGGARRHPGAHLPGIPRGLRTGRLPRRCCSTPTALTACPWIRVSRQRG